MVSIKFPFQLDTIMIENQLTYPMSFINVVDESIKEGLWVFSYEEDKTETPKKENFVGSVISYNIRNNFVTLQLDIANEKYAKLRNESSYIKGTPNIEATVDETGIINATKINYIMIVV